MGLDILSLFAEREAERYAFFASLNEQWCECSRLIGYDVGFAPRAANTCMTAKERNTSIC